MSTPLTLPSRPDLGWLKKQAKDHLAELRAADPEVRLADAQRAIARRYGFPSWRALKAHVDAARAAIESAAASVSPTVDDVMRAFLSAVGSGERERVERAVAAAPNFVNAVGPHPFWGGRVQALHVAIESNRPELFEFLLAHGADVNGAAADYLRWTPLLLSVHWRRPEMTRALLERGAAIGLAEALALGDDARVDGMLDDPGAGAIQSPAPNDGTFLHFARTPHAIDRLLAAGVSLERKDHWGASVVEALSRLGPSGAALVAHVTARGAATTPAELARIGDGAALERLASTDPAGVRASSTLKAAVDFGHHRLVRWLIELGCDVNGRTGGEADATALHSAAWNGDLEMVQLLVDSGADVRARDAQYDAPPLGWAETAIRVTNNPRCAEVADYLRPITEP